MLDSHPIRLEYFFVSFLQSLSARRMFPALTHFEPGPLCTLFVLTPSLFPEVFRISKEIGVDEPLGGTGSTTSAASGDWTSQEV